MEQIPYKPSRLIARCSCYACFYDTPRGWQQMLSHINDNNNVVHQWVEVTDLVVVRELEEV